ITYNVEDAVKVHKLNPNLMISVTARSEKEYERLAAAGIPDNRMVAFIGTREPNAEFNKFLHEKCIITILGTLGNLDKMAASKGNQLYSKWFSEGVDIFSTDRPTEANQAIKSK
ncbi:MAG: glycerophosphodiester phosphodiesterase, partial [Spirosomaceae bacterium]|nr:glycerophosphodiester phosphodiesterase [Spirosomataceae bacterium]